MSDVVGTVNTYPMLLLMCMPKVAILDYGLFCGIIACTVVQAKFCFQQNWTMDVDAFFSIDASEVGH